ncbi:hypothetical protein J6590_010848 [Homalodisca vitripennis]|nr:hypothetical protein J6590_010848 [Homalodisca vitripennis]
MTFACCNHGYLYKTNRDDRSQERQRRQQALTPPQSHNGSNPCPKARRRDNVSDIQCRS